MMKNTLVYVSVFFLALTILACKTKGEQGENSKANLPAMRTDSLVGFEGCNRAGFKAISENVFEYKYQYYTFRTTIKEDGAELIEFTIDTIGKKFAKVSDLEPTYFRGCVRGHFFVDIGTAPDVREMIIYSLQNGVMSQVYRVPYLVKYPPFIASNGQFYFFRPVDEAEVSTMPECPDKEAWLEKGLKVGYGQRYMYNLVNRGLTRKSEFVCASLQQGD